MQSTQSHRKVFRYGHWIHGRLKHKIPIIKLVTVIEAFMMRQRLIFNVSSLFFLCVGGLLSYTMPQGSKRGENWNFYDHT
jgi:hypothetical protein